MCVNSRKTNIYLEKWDKMRKNYFSTEKEHFLRLFFTGKFVFLRKRHNFTEMLTLILFHKNHGFPNSADDKPLLLYIIFRNIEIIFIYFCIKISYP